MKPSSSRPTSLWFLNHDLEPDELIWQMNEMAEKGFGGLFIHPRDGLLTPYNSAKWWEMVEIIIDHGAKVGMDIWLYDEDPYPSGTAGGQVLAEHPEYAAQSLSVTKKRFTGPQRVLLDTPIGVLAGAFAAGSGGEILDITERCGLVRSAWVGAKLSRTLYYPPYGDHGNPHNRSGATPAHLRLDWDAPEGDWTVMMFTVSRSTGAKWGNGYVDCMNPAAIKRFMELTHEEYYARFGDRFGKLIPGIFTDEPKVLTSLPWSPVLPDSYASLWSEEIAPMLPHLVQHVDGNTPRIRYQYRKSIATAFRRAYSQQISTWCEERKIASTGHLSPEEDPIGQVYMTPGLMGWLREQHIPGLDIIADLTGDIDRPLLQVGPKLVSSVAHQSGRSHVLCEALAVVDWVQTLADMKRICDWVMVLGANLISYHAQHYSIDGLRKREAPPSQFYQAPYWRFFGYFNQYIERICGFLTGGTTQVSVAIFYPEATLMALLPDSEQKARQIVESFSDILDGLLTSQIDCDLIDEEALAEGVLTGGRLRCGDVTYRTIIIPGKIFLTDDARKSLQSFIDGGGVVLSLSEHLLSFGDSIDDKEEVLTGLTVVKPDALIESVAGVCPPPIYVDPPARLIVQHRVVDGENRLFVVNNQDSAFDGQIAIDIPGSAEVRVQDGPSHVHDTTEPMAMSLPPWGSATITVTEDSAPELSEPEEWGTLADLSQGWAFSPESDNIATLRDWHIVTDADRAFGGFANYLTMDILKETMLPEGLQESDELWLVCRFDVADTIKPLWLVRESDISPADVDWWVNGEQVETWASTRRYDVMNMQADISNLVKPGLNCVTMRLSGLGAVPPDQKQVRAVPYLYGGFELQRPWSHPSPVKLRHIGFPISLQGLPSWTEIGLADFAGTCEYTRKLEIDERWLDGANLALSVSICDDVAELSINGKKVGSRAWYPYRWTGLEKFLKPGVNTLSIKVANTPANMFLGVHKSAGIRGTVLLESDDSSHTHVT